MSNGRGKSPSRKSGLNDLAPNGEKVGQALQNPPYEGPEDQDEGALACPFCKESIYASAMSDHFEECSKYLKFQKQTGLETKKKTNKNTYVEDTLKEEWAVVCGDFERSKIPPVEQDLSAKKGYTCQWGCVTKKTGVAKGFLSKGSFLEHIADEHPHLRLIVETPPTLDLNGHPSQGRRLIVQQSDVLAKHDC